MRNWEHTKCDSNTRSHALRGNAASGRSAARPGRGASLQCVPTRSVGTSCTGFILHPSSFILLLFLLLPAPLFAKSGMGGGAIEAEAKSDYSHIRIRRQGNVRTMNFVRDNGEEHIQTLWNIKRPYDLVTNYSRLMFSNT